MTSRLLSALALSAALCARGAAAQVGGGILLPTENQDVSRVSTRGAAFLSLGVGARPLGLAGAYAATATDLSAMYWNVAGIGDVEQATAFASREQLFGSSGLSNSFIAAAIPLFGGALGVSFTSFQSGEIERTTEAWPEGNDPTLGAVVNWSATSVGVHYARPLTDRLVVGGTVKRADEGIEFARATYFAADVGIRFRSGLAGSTLGVSIANLGSTGRLTGPAVTRRVPRRDIPQFPTGRPVDIELRTTNMQLPTTLRIGVQTELVGTAESLLSGVGDHRVTLFSDVTDAIDTKTMPALAAEYGYRGRFFLRGGGRYVNEGRVDGGNMNYSAGAGFQLQFGERRLMLDYAYRRMGDLNGNQVFSFQFGG
jgi:hypothetical protein